MPKLSAGLLVHRLDASSTMVEVLLVHPGGPFWAKKDAGAWSVPKGEYEEGEDPVAVARREFEEEIGQPAPDGRLIELGELKQPSGKRITAWALTGEVDSHHISSNTFDMEWPKNSGKTESFPEVDRADWFPVAIARQKILKGQAPFLDRLLDVLRQEIRNLSEGESSAAGQVPLF